MVVLMETKPGGKSDYNVATMLRQLSQGAPTVSPSVNLLPPKLRRPPVLSSAHLTNRTSTSRSQLLPSRLILLRRQVGPPAKLKKPAVNEIKLRKPQPAPGAKPTNHRSGRPDPTRNPLPVCRPLSWPVIPPWFGQRHRRHRQNINIE